MHGGGELETIAVAMHLQSRRLSERRGAHAGAVVLETVGCPVERGREVELMVSAAARRADERLEAGMSPQAIRAPPGTDAWQAQSCHVGAQRVAAAERAAGRELGFRHDAPDDLAAGIRMSKQVRPL